MRMRNAVATTAAIVAGAAGSLVLAQAPAQAANCVPVISFLGAPLVRHASCQSGSANIRVVLYCRIEAGVGYTKYGPWVFSNSIDASSAAACRSGEVVQSAWYEL